MTNDAAHDLGLYKQAYETPYGECFTLPDGDCIGRGCMHDDAARVLADAVDALREIAQADGGAYTQDYQPDVDRLAAIAEKTLKKHGYSV